MIYTNPVICPVPKRTDPTDSVTPEICTDDNLYTNPVICPVPKHTDPADSVTSEICTDDIHKPYDLPSTKTHRSCRLSDS